MLDVVVAASDFDWTTYAKQLPFAFVFFAILYVGYRGNVWMYVSTHLQLMQGKDRELALKDQAYKRQEEELERERTRALRYEEHTIRLLEAAREATSIAAKEVAKRSEASP